MRPMDNGKILDEIEIEIECKQMLNGNIYIELLGVKREKMPQLMKYFTHIDFSLTGKTNDGYRIGIPELILINFTVSSKSGIKVKFIPKKTVEISNGKIDMKKPLLYRFYLINADFPNRNSLEMEWGKINIIPLQNYEEIIRDMKTSRTPLISGILEILVYKASLMGNNEANIEERIEKITHKILNLLSLARGVWISYAVTEVRQRTDTEKNEWKLKKLVHLIPKKKTPSFTQPLIPFSKITDYLDKTLKNYSDELDEKLGFNVAIEWFIEAFSPQQNLEACFIKAFTALEVVKDRFARANKIEFILDERVFREIYDILKDTAKEKMRSMGVESPQRGEIYKKLGGINRRSIKNILIELFGEYDIEVDNVDELNHLQEIINIRNEITHKGISDRDIKKLITNYKRLAGLLQKIFLSILNYKEYFA